MGPAGPRAVLHRPLVAVRRPHRILLALLLAGCGPASNSESDAAAPLCAPTLPAIRDRYTDADVGALRQFRQSPLGTVAFSDNSPPANRITNPYSAMGLKLRRRTDSPTLRNREPTNTPPHTARNPPARKCL